MSTKTPSPTASLPHRTAIDIPAEAREKLVVILNQQLANLSDLYSQTKQAHWNVRGQEFYQLHKLFDDLAEPLEEPIDIIAERAVTLGGMAFGTVRDAAKASELKEFPHEPGAMEYAQEARPAVCHRGEFSAKGDRSDTDELGDADSADLLTDVSRELDKSVYFLEAHVRS